MKIGKYELNLIETGTFGLDGGAMFGIVPKPLWQKTNSPDEMNRITLGARCMLLRSESKTILIDTGIGQNWDEKFCKIYRVEENGSYLLKSLNKFGVEPTHITDVILTHLHFDHTGGSTRLENQTWIPAFPRADYFVQKEHFEWAINPSERDRGSFIKERFVPLQEAGVLNLLDGVEQFDDEIEFIVINGHTFAQQMIKISDSQNTFLFCADLIPTSSHIPIPYVMGYDLQPLKTVGEKKKILSKAVEEEWKLIFEHDPTTPAATITKNEKGFIIKEKYESL